MVSEFWWLVSFEKLIHFSKLENFICRTFHKLFFLLLLLLILVIVRCDHQHHLWCLGFRNESAKSFLSLATCALECPLSILSGFLN